MVLHRNLHHSLFWIILLIAARWYEQHSNAIQWLKERFLSAHFLVSFCYLVSNFLLHVGEIKSLLFPSFLHRPLENTPLYVRLTTCNTFQWPVIERDRVGGLRLIIWDKVKVPLCHYRVMHRKRVTPELHDSYFRLMTIKHSISKIEWASNDYITPLSSTSQGVASWVAGNWQLSSAGAVGLKIGRSYRRDVVGKATSGRRCLWALMSWGPEKMLIRCCKESHQPAEWPLRHRLSI